MEKRIELILMYIDLQIETLNEEIKLNEAKTKSDIYNAGYCRGSIHELQFIQELLRKK